MRPELSRLCRDIRTSSGPRRATRFVFLVFVCGCVCGWVCCVPAAAQQATVELRFDASVDTSWAPPSTDQVRDAAVLALPSTDLSLDSKQLKVTRRPDLEDLLSSIAAAKGIHGLNLYQVEMPTQASFDGQWTWTVAVVARKPGAYEMYSFESTGKRGDVAGDFNRFAAQLSLSLSKDELPNFAAFFLETAIPIRRGELVLDQDALRETVGRHYYTAYDEAYRSIDAYSEWWHRFLDGQNLPELTPKAEAEPDGRYRVTLSRVVTTEGAHPQLQQWQMEISPEGNVRTVAMRTVFPKAPRWIFYDSPGQPPPAPLIP
jgi:hypothetical protein